MGFRPPLVDLPAALHTEFDLVLVQASEHSNPHPYRIQDFVSRIKDYQQVEAYDPQHDDGPAVKRVFAEPQQDMDTLFRGLNLLNITNPEHRRFCPLRQRVLGERKERTVLAQSRKLVHQHRLDAVIESAGDAELCIPIH
jgi:hypothetical protein